MANFFIDRPIFAWVVAIFITLAGILTLPLMPIARYPQVAPPQITVSTNYPGATPEDIYQSVTRPIEEELNGVPGLLYFESVSEASGRIALNVTFETGTNVGEAQVEVQNRIARVEPRLPSAVTQQGIRVDRAGTSFLMMVVLRSEDGRTDAVGLGDYLSRNVIGELRRVPGVGNAQLFATQRSMRVWMDPDRMVGLNLTAADITDAITAQNAQVTAGRVGASPNLPGQQTSAIVNVQGQLRSPQEFGEIVLRANPDGSTVRLRDVARVEVGGENYNFASRLNGQPSANVGIQLTPIGNALATAEQVRTIMEDLSRYFPPGLSYEVSYDTTPFVEVSIEKVVHTLLEAIVLVFIVMFLFLQNIRYTIIPTLVVPVALLGACAVMYAAGFSINVLTMFAMVLAIGILVDDAIVVVENVERIMAEEKLSPKEATKKAMSQITGAIIGITLVLTAVFIPMAFFPGAVGVIYQQFSLTMVVSILFSGLLALTFTPALCASFLKPVTHGHERRTFFFRWFNRGFDSLTRRYSVGVGATVRRAGRFMLIYLALLGGLGWAYLQLPNSFLPNEDQGYLIAELQAPAEASTDRTREAIRRMEGILMEESAIRNVVAVSGFSYSGSGQNAGLAFITLKDWSERGPSDSAAAIAARVNAKFAAIRDASVRALSPPPIQGLGTSNGFAYRLQDRSGAGQAALAAASAQLLNAARASPMLVGVRVEGLPDAAQINLMIDREKANAFGVGFSDINATLSANFGSSYINDYPNAGRMQRVTVQAGAVQRMQTQDLLRLNVRNSHGSMVPLSAFASIDWVRGPSQVVGYNGYPSIRIGGQAAAGHSSGDAIAEMERLSQQLPAGFGFEWTGQSFQEIQSGSQAPFLIGLSILFVFLLLAALYESWSIPLSVMLVVPLGVLGSVLAVMLRGLPNDIYFLVGLIAIIGLSAKNAILIVEFAKDLVAEGRSVREAAIEAARMRFRPILMTSLAFTLGVVPLAIATGASAASQNAIGTGVLGGMISATLLAIFFVPVFFAFVVGFLRKPEKSPHPREPELTNALGSGIHET
ncbi:multidrug efflux RND transporter permease subunit [Rhizobium sp. RCC_161_2]|uniref:multidrug efflux RND transporter permease subunit n=1 Tax=Rhizobium sp. RCC_161_2 TaxID=3239219 RepID=UPI0035252126